MNPFSKHFSRFLEFYTADLVYVHPQAYVDMRKIGSGRGMVSAYPRQLESLIRLAEAHAKVRFSEKVETIDVEEAKRLHREALKQSATDPRTGFVDISILTTGTEDNESISKGADMRN